MNKLCALAASLIIGAASFGAQAGDRHRGHHDHGNNHRHYERDHGHWRDHDHRRVTIREYRPVYYHAVPVYQPVRYYSREPVYRERVRYRDNDVHGSITIGF
jgi:ABC-type Zn2+ transport system substrate-binding protein/surface adhesin